MQTSFLRSLIPTSWKTILKPNSNADSFLNLEAWVQNEYAAKEVFPPVTDIFNAFKSCSPTDVKVVIIGQDPYHGDGQAHGLSFSVKKGVRQPPSLKNIFKELYTDLDITIPDKNNGDLSSWATQGVFLLNTVLTVTKSKPDSHKNKGWEQFTDATIKAISDHQKNVVFILWGAKALVKKELINHNNHLVLTSFHPSPFSARKGFFGSQPFSKANNYLKSTNQTPINWEI